ncbi:hypothetical protein FNYG_15180 [Fusarium nygamai]|uniref:Uncharacterized protein n=1 Tax=Gibberella nygamai TaxID=42673 RepID=A0A2K0UJ05_GIBNY|nr:hypothetical protein FNYG_15180 [Fusarium nygamai]
MSSTTDDPDGLPDPSSHCPDPRPGKELSIDFRGCISILAISKPSKKLPISIRPPSGCLGLRIGILSHYLFWDKYDGTTSDPLGVPIEWLKDMLISAKSLQSSPFNMSASGNHFSTSGWTKNALMSP